MKPVNAHARCAVVLTERVVDWLHFSVGKPHTAHAMATVNRVLASLAGDDVVIVVAYGAVNKADRFLAVCTDRPRGRSRTRWRCMRRDGRGERTMDNRSSFRRLEDVERQWDADPELREAYRREVPYAEVARAIIGLRTRHGLNQSEFAARVGRPQSYIARLESGRANVEVGTLMAFAQALGERIEIEFDTQAAAQGIAATT